MAVVGRLGVRDLADQPFAELVPGVRLLLVQGHRQSEGAALPGGGKHQLAVFCCGRRPARYTPDLAARPSPEADSALIRRRSVAPWRLVSTDGARTRATPIIESRVTSPPVRPRSRALQRAGRSGSTR